MLKYDQNMSFAAVAIIGWNRQESEPVWRAACEFHRRIAKGFSETNFYFYSYFYLLLFVLLTLVPLTNTNILFDFCLFIVVELEQR